MFCFSLHLCLRAFGGLCGWICFLGGLCCGLVLVCGVEMIRLGFGLLTSLCLGDFVAGRFGVVMYLRLVFPVICVIWWCGCG